MRITDELREYLLCHPPANYADFSALADRIDAEHDEAIQQVMMSEGVPATEENMAEFGWVRLPKDADGEYIHIGDVMEWPTTNETFEVVGIGDGTLFYVEDGNEKADWTGASTKRHYHAPTVEDVLREFMDVMLGTPSKDAAARIAEYAAKLQLKEDA